MGESDQVRKHQARVIESNVPQRPDPRMLMATHVRRGSRIDKTSREHDRSAYPPLPSFERTPLFDVKGHKRSLLTQYQTHQKDGRAAPWSPSIILCSMGQSGLRGFVEERLHGFKQPEPILLHDDRVCTLRKFDVSLARRIFE